MSDLDKIVREIFERNKSKTMALAVVQADFHLKCSHHFKGYILPEMQRFQSAVKQQIGISIKPLYQYDHDAIRGGLIVDIPGNIQKTLYAVYNFSDKNLSLLETRIDRGTGYVKRSTCAIFPTLEDMTPMELYTILEGFVCESLNEIEKYEAGKTPGAETGSPAQTEPPKDEAPSAGKV
jgi:hypothetical protein